MRTSDAFPSNYLRATDLKGKQPVVTIDKVVLETIGKDSKLVVYFKGTDKGLVLNKTNANGISDLLGTDETDDWAGKKIKLVTAMVEYQGRRVPAVRVEEASGTVSRKPAPPPEPEPEIADDDIPF